MAIDVGVMIRKSKWKVRKPRARRLGIARSTRAANAAKALATRSAMATELRQYWKQENDFIDHFSAKYKIKKSTALRRVRGVGLSKNRREINIYNAWLHCTSLDRNLDRRV